MTKSMFMEGVLCHSIPIKHQQLQVQPEIWRVSEEQRKEHNTNQACCSIIKYYYAITLSSRIHNYGIEKKKRNLCDRLLDQTALVAHAVTMCGWTRARW